MARPKIGGGQLESEIWRSIQESAAENAGGGAHVHPVSEVTDLQDALDSKASAVHNHDAAYAAIDHTHEGGGAAWGGITGTLANQTDLQTALDGKSGTGHNHDAAYEPKNANIQAHVAQAHAPSDAQKNSDITKAEIEAVLTGEIASHSHAGGGGGVTLAEVIDALYPVGALYTSTLSTNPGTLLGRGTWTAFGAGRVMVGHNAGDTDFDTAEETGGAKTSSAVVNHTHPVVVDDPQHSHVENSNNATTGGLRGWGAPDTSTNTPTATGYSTAPASTGITATTSNPAGGVASFSLMNPYIVVYAWKRTA